jgi:hypothetical protein
MRCADIVGAFKASLGKLEWMDKKSAVAAAEKVSSKHKILARFDMLHAGRRYPNQSRISPIT